MARDVEAAQQGQGLLEDFAYDALPSLPEEGLGAPELQGSESYEWGAIPNLDLFFTRVYRYYEEKGFAVIVTSRSPEPAGPGLHRCPQRVPHPVAIYKHPLSHGSAFFNAMAIAYLVIFGLYWLFCAARLPLEVREVAEVAHFVNLKLGISERTIRTITWPEIARRLVEVQRTTKLCIKRDLTEIDVVARIMRKENYLIGMLNKGVLALNVPVPGLRGRFMLTTTLEWNLRWCLLDWMFDERHFRIREGFTADPAALRRRFKCMAVANLLLSPFLLVFLLIFFFLRNAEKFYHHPSTVGARRYSALARWRLREFNELPHYISHRLNASHKAAEKYVSQFPSPVLTHCARFVAFIAGSFAALLLFMMVLDDTLLERHLAGRNLVWWAALLGVVLAISRAFIQETGTAFDPELAMLEVVAHTHYLPRHWRGRAGSREVQEQFQALFQFKALLLVEEVASILLTPFVLYFSLPKCAGAITQFVRDFTTHVEGVGDVCSLAAFDFAKHGNSKYGAPANCPKAARSRQGKMEKSFLSFAATYPAWEPDAPARQLLSSIAALPGIGGGGSGAAAAAMPSAQYPYTNLVPDTRMHTAAASQFMGAAAARYLPFGMAPPFANAGASFGRHYGALHSIFGSAEMPSRAPGTTVAGSTAAPTPAPSLPASVYELSPAGGAEGRVAAGQLLLQSLYEERAATASAQQSDGARDRLSQSQPHTNPTVQQQASSLQQYPPPPPHLPGRAPHLQLPASSPTAASGPGRPLSAAWQQVPAPPLPPLRTRSGSRGDVGRSPGSAGGIGAFASEMATLGRSPLHGIDAAG